MAKKGTTRAASDKQEGRLQKKMGGYRPPNSGAGMFKKGDLLLDDLFIDGKTSMIEVTQKAVKLAELEKAKEQGYFMGKEFYALALCFGTNKDFFILEDNDFMLIYEGYQKYKKVLDLIGDLDEMVTDSPLRKELKSILR